jgi:hypothetical protein
MVTARKEAQSLPGSTSHTDGSSRQVCWVVIFYQVVLTAFIPSLSFQTAPQLRIGPGGLCNHSYFM